MGDAAGEDQPSSPHHQLCSEHPPLLIQGGRTLVILICFADIYISISMETFEHRKYIIRGDNGNS